MRREKLAVVLAGLALAAQARADFELWNEVGASLKVADGVRLGLDQHLRLDHGASEVDHVRPEAWIAWRAVKWLSLRLGYRYDIEPHYTLGADYADGWHEAYADANLRDKVRGVRLSLRLRVQEEWGRPWEADGALVSTHKVRQRIEIEWPAWRKIALFGSGELFLALADPDGLLDKWRAAAGISLGKGDHGVSVRYLLEHPVTGGAEVAHVLGLSYHFSR